MGVNPLHITAPAVAAAIGIYFFEKIHSNSKELGGGVRTSIANIAAKMREEMKSSRVPKLAPQFDGLHCFETLVD
ncbi:hypothetical protein Vadar_006632 [Vaccinium darrowii]|uniref:Uncharacterized protein n=1 Tax=Vaccinium darrowii TaxID=229202 RepID=A0ACB7YJW4_9ERIC|nr:hypothetical protein Vadar_006632 [Vaccinium darrowii]